MKNKKFLFILVGLILGMVLQQATWAQNLSKPNDPDRKSVV